jgi:para-nitrobenzyl esterase
VAALGGPLGGVYGDGPRLCPVVDGVVLPDHPFDPVASACSTGVPLLIGTVKDETSTMASAVPGLWDMAPEDQVAMLTDGFFGHELDDLLPAYAGTRPDATPLVRFLAASSDQLRVGSITIAERHAAAEGAAPVFMYRMDYETPVLGGRLGAMHTLDVGFVFDNVHLSSAYPDDGSAHAMAKRMSGSWAAFARTGDPNNAMVPAWPPYDVDRRATMVFDEDTRVVDDPDGEERLAWAGRPGGL